MLEDTVFSLANASAMQIAAFVGFAICTIGFCLWLVYLVRE